MKNISTVIAAIGIAASAANAHAASCSENPEWHCGAYQAIEIAKAKANQAKAELLAAKKALAAAKRADELTKAGRCDGPIMTWARGCIVD